MVEAELGLGDPRALVFQAGVFDIVVGALVAEPQAHGGLAHTVAVQHAFGAELWLRLSPSSLKGSRWPAARAVVALAVAVGEGPPAPGQAVEQALAVGMAPAVGHRVAVGAQVELVGQAQRAVPVQAQAHLLLAGADVAVVVARGGDPPGLVALALETHPAAPTSLPGTSSSCAWRDGRRLNWSTSCSSSRRSSSSPVLPGKLIASSRGLASAERPGPPGGLRRR